MAVPKKEKYHKVMEHGSSKGWMTKKQQQQNNKRYFKNRTWSTTERTNEKKKRRNRSRNTVLGIQLVLLVPKVPLYWDSFSYT